MSLPRAPPAPPRAVAFLHGFPLPERAVAASAAACRCAGGRAPGAAARRHGRAHGMRGAPRRRRRGDDLASHGCRARRRRARTAARVRHAAPVCRGACFSAAVEGESSVARFACQPTRAPALRVRRACSEPPEAPRLALHPREQHRRPRQTRSQLLPPGSPRRLRAPLCGVACTTGSRARTCSSCATSGTRPAPPRPRASLARGWCGQSKSTPRGSDAPGGSPCWCACAQPACVQSPLAPRRRRPALC